MPTSPNLDHKWYVTGVGQAATILAPQFALVPPIRSMHWSARALKEKCMAGAQCAQAQAKTKKSEST